MEEMWDLVLGIEKELIFVIELNEIIFLWMN